MRRMHCMLDGKKLTDVWDGTVGPPALIDKWDAVVLISTAVQRASQLPSSSNQAYQTACTLDLTCMHAEWV